MPPFTNGTNKATRKPPKDSEQLNPDGVQMRRFEREGKEQIAAALAQWQRDLFRGVTTANAQQRLIERLNDQSVIQPLQDVITALVQEWALAGAGFGQEQVERNVFGTIKATAAKQTDPLGINWELANNAASEWALNHSAELVRQIGDTTRARIQTEVANFVQNDETINQLRDRLIGLPDDAGNLFGTMRAERIAVTEVTRSFSEANQIAWAESGVIDGKEWRTNNDELVCLICGPLADNVVPTGQQFDGGFDGPPAHPRCRCWVVPVPVMTEAEGVTAGAEPQLPIDLERERFRRFKADPFGGEDDIADWAQNASYDAWNAGLSSKEREWLKLYKQEGYEWINTGLRGDFGPLDEAFTAQTRTDFKNAKKFIDQAVKRHRLPNDITLWRGGSHPEITRMLDAGHSLDDLVGMQLGDDAYMSTSLNVDSADDFVKWAGKDAVRFEIQAPRGTFGSYIEYMDPGLQEFEYLLARGSKLEILEASIQGGVRNVVARVVAP